MSAIIPLFYPYIPKKKILTELADTLSSRWLGQGSKVELFENKFASKMGYKFTVMVNSGTSALELAYHLLNLKAGDRVVVPVLNAIAGQVGLIRRQCQIIFCDIEKNTLNLDPIHLEKILTTTQVKAVIGVHLGGIHFSPQVNVLCKQFGVALIVDAAQYLAPTTGDYICYSFQAIKHITTGDGGMLVLRNLPDYHRAKNLRWFGIKRKKIAGWQLRDATASITEAGYKYQPTDIVASFALAAWDDVDQVINYRQQLVNKYQLGLANVKEIQIIASDTYWLMTVLAKRRNQLAVYLTKQGIETNIVHIRNDRYPIFSPGRLDLPNMNWIERRYLCLPLNPKVTKSNVKLIVQHIKKFYAQT